MAHWWWFLLFISLPIHPIQAQTPQAIERFYRNQSDLIRTSKITYLKTVTIPPIELRGGTESITERKNLIADQWALFNKVKKSKNFDPKIESEVLNTILVFLKEIYEPRIYHQEVTYITTPAKRCHIIKKISPGEPFVQKRVYDGESSFIYIPTSGEKIPFHNRIWWYPKDGLCRFGADLEWWLDKGFTIAMNDERYTLVDPYGKEIAFFESNSENAWTKMVVSNGKYTITAADFQNINGLSVPRIATVYQKILDGTLYEIERMELGKAEINIPIDDNIFQTSKEAFIRNPRLMKSPSK